MSTVNISNITLEYFLRDITSEFLQESLEKGIATHNLVLAAVAEQELLNRGNKDLVIEVIIWALDEGYISQDSDLIAQLGRHSISDEVFVSPFDGEIICPPFADPSLKAAWLSGGGPSVAVEIPLTGNDC